MMELDHPEKRSIGSDQSTVKKKSPEPPRTKTEEATKRKVESMVQCARIP